MLNKLLHDAATHALETPATHFPPRYVHLDLPTLLKDRDLAIDVTRRGPFVDLRINGFTHVARADGLARDGVVHVLESVLIPPRQHHGAETVDEGISVEEFKARFEGLVEEDGEEGPEMVVQGNRQLEL